VESVQHSQSTVGLQMFQNLYVLIFMCRIPYCFLSCGCTHVDHRLELVLADDG